MYRWLAVILLLATTVPALAAGAGSTPVSRLCRRERPLVRELWQRGLYQAPAAAVDVVVAAIHGDVTKTRQGLAVLPPPEAARWRQVAMYTAAEQGRTAVVGALLDDGAVVDRSAEMPALNTTLYGQTMDAISHRPPFDAAAVKRMEAMGIVGNRPQATGPAIFVAIGCNDLATVSVFLRHHTNPMKGGWPAPRSADPFISAVVLGEAAITEAFLDHGARPCVEDDRLRTIAESSHHPVTTVARVGQKEGLSAALIKRLECHVSNQ